MSRKNRLVSLIGIALFCALAFFGLSATPALAATYTPTPPSHNTPPPPPHRTPAPPSNNSCQPNLAPGNRSDSVRELQILLNKFGFRGPNGRPLAVSGYFDNNTLFAVKQFEARHHLPQNGRVDARHWQFLGLCGR
jgi:peptidoglycan hydrolase-like protein with peptidoglycan-binding domain